MITDNELLSMAVAFNVGPEAFVNGKLIDEEMIARLKKSGEYNRLCCSVKWTGSKWVISNGPSCLNRLGEWEYASIPSEQTEGFRSRIRFDTPQEAIEFFREHRATTVRIYLEIKDVYPEVGCVVWNELDKRIEKVYRERGE